MDRESGSYSRSAFNDDRSRFRRIALSLEGIEEHPPGRNPKEFKFVNHHGRFHGAPNSERECHNAKGPCHTRYATRLLSVKIDDSSLIMLTGMYVDCGRSAGKQIGQHATDSTTHAIITSASPCFSRIWK